MRKVICDRCGAGIPAKKEHGFVWLGFRESGAAEEEPEPAAPTKAKTVKPKELDTAKIKALYRAGWNYRQITDELKNNVSAKSCKGGRYEATDCIRQYQGV